jgi:hypothetical protein
MDETLLGQLPPLFEGWVLKHGGASGSPKCRYLWVTPRSIRWAKYRSGGIMGALPSEQVLACDLASFASGTSRHKSCDVCSQAVALGAIPMRHQPGNASKMGGKRGDDGRIGGMGEKMADVVVRAGTPVALDGSGAGSSLVSRPAGHAPHLQRAEIGESGTARPNALPTPAAPAVRWPAPLWPNHMAWQSGSNTAPRRLPAEKRPKLLWDRPCVLLSVAAGPSRGRAAATHASRRASLTAVQWVGQRASSGSSATRVIELYPLSLPQASQLCHALSICGICPWFQHCDIPSSSIRLLPLQPVVRPAIPAPAGEL